MRALSGIAGVLLCVIAPFMMAQRINHEGRILGPMPQVTAPVLFNTPEADAVVSAMQILPVTNPWNEDISHRPVLTNSAAIIARIMSDLREDRRTLIAFQEMNYVLVPDNQPREPIQFFNYSDESDLDGGVDPEGLYPIPPNLPVEGWPTQVDGTLEDWQEAEDDSDRHSIMVAPGSGFIWETWLTRLTGDGWEASNGAKFDLNSNAQRPAGWTSGDAAGLPMFPALVRFDECERGLIEHACRIVVGKSRYRNYIYPATHYAASTNNIDPNLPSMGQRVRLREGFAIPENWTTQEKAVLRGLKKYGAMVADNGNFFSISVTPDDRWPAGCFNHFTGISITNFEVIVTTGPAEGPRSPGAPAAVAGPDQTVAPGQPAQLQGFISYASASPEIRWKLYSGPGSATFSDSSTTNATVTFTIPGTYTLMLSVADGVHPVAYDAMVITVGSTLLIQATHVDSFLILTWTGGLPPFSVERSLSLSAPVWTSLTNTPARSFNLPMTDPAGFFRIRGQ